MLDRRKFVTATLSGAAALTLAGCNDTSSDESDESGSTSYNIGICQLVQHDALDLATEGFQARFSELIEADGSGVEYDLQNASGDSSTCASIINSFVSSGVDLIMANATAALQAAQAGTSEIPILGTSITDYATALGMDEWDGTSGTNISGTSDLAPLREQALMLYELFPDAETVGLLYCSAEPNSIYQIEVITPILEELGYTCTEFTFADSNDVASVATAAANASDVIYIPTDNTAASCAETIGDVIVPAGVPAVVGEEGICSGCGVATLSIDYYELGQITAEMAYEVLVEGADISSMEVRSAETITMKYNAEICDELGVTPPADYVAIEVIE